MSILGISHTGISVIALVVAAICFRRDGAVRPYTVLGKWYSILTVIACVSSFGLSRTGHLNPGHALGVLIMLLLAAAYFFDRKNTSTFQYMVLFCMTTTIFLSLLPAINETLTRLPASHPLSSGPTAPVVLHSIKVLLLLYLAGLAIQVLRRRKTLQNR